MPKNKTWSLYLLFFVLFGFAIFLGYSLFNESKTKQQKESFAIEPQFSGLKTKEEEIEWEGLLERAREDCKSEETFKSQEERDDYFYNLSKDLLVKLDVERDISLVFEVARIPRTYSCYAIWMGNDEGEGFGGYITKSNDIATYSIKFTKESLRETFDK